MTCNTCLGKDEDHLLANSVFGAPPRRERSKFSLGGNSSRSFLPPCLVGIWGWHLESRVGPGHGSCCWAQGSGSRHCWTTLRPRKHEAWTGHGPQEIPFRDVKSSGEQVVSGKEGAELRSEHQAEARGSCPAGGRSSVAGRGVGRGRGPRGRRLAPVWSPPVWSHVGVVFT